MADWPSWWPQLTLWYTLFIQFWQSWSKTSWPYMTVIELSITGLKEISVQSQCHPWVKQVLSLKLLKLHCKNASEWYSEFDIQRRILAFETAIAPIVMALSCYSPHKSDNGCVGAANILKMFLLKETATGQNKGCAYIVSFKVIVTHFSQFLSVKWRIVLFETKRAFCKETRSQIILTKTLRICGLLSGAWCVSMSCSV